MCVRSKCGGCRLWAWVGSAVLLSAFSLAAPVRAQDGGSFATSVVGPTGNASAYFNNRVPSALGNRSALSTFRTYQGRPASGSLSALSPLGGGGLLPGQLPASGYYLDNTTSLGLFGLGMARATRASPSGVVGNPFSPLLDAPRYYGGFTKRAGGARPASMDQILRRRPSMIAASSLNAPVRRAMGGVSLPAAAWIREQSRTVGGFLPPTGDERDPITMEELESRPPLSTLVAEQIEFMGLRAKSEAWARFHAGEYRRAVRTFQSAITLDPGNPEPRIGEMFCYLATGGYRTAMAAMREITRRSTNPFMFNLNLRDGRYEGDIRSFGTLQEVRRMRTALSQIERIDESDDPGSDRLPLMTLALWYLGQRESARGLLIRGMGGDPRHKYADWPQLMVDANTRIPASTP